MIGEGRKSRFSFLSLALSLVFLLAGTAPSWAASGTKTLQFNPQPASPVLKESRWAQFAVRVLLSNGTLDSKNNKTKITVLLNVSSGATGVLSGTPVTKTVNAGVATFALPTDPAISYNQAETIALKATASDIANYSKTSNFVTVLAPFAVSAVSPAEGAVNVPATTSVSASFNRSVNASTVNPTNFSLTPSVAGTYSVSGSTATFSPSAPLSYNTTYTATVTTAVKDTYGFPLGSAKTWSFTTSAPPPPASLEFNPQPSSPALMNRQWTAFAVRALKSDGTLDAGNNTTQITLSLTSGGTGVLSGTKTITVAAGVATFTDIAYSQAGTISLKATASDIAGYSATSNFVTVLSPFAASGWAPANQATNSPVSYPVSVTFNRPVNTTTVNATSFYLTPSIAGTYSFSGNTATFTPNPWLAYSTTYTATVTTAVSDANGFPLGTAKTWSFTTAAPPPPTLAFNPAPASTAFTNSTWAPFAVRILKGDGSLDTGNNTSQITLALNNGTGVLSGTLTRTVAAGVASFNDISYNLAGSIALKASTPDIPGYSKTSNTVTVLAPFAITSVNPVENAADFPTNVGVTVNFNRSVNASTVNSATFFVTPSVAGTYSVQGTEVRFFPSTYLENNTTYTAIVTTGVSDTSGNPLAAEKTWSFTTWNPPPPVWSEPAAISQGTGNDSVSYCWEGADFRAVWRQSTNNQYGLFSNRYTPGLGWDGVQTVVPLSSTLVASPATALEASQMDVLWVNGPYPYHIFSSLNTFSWTTPQDLGPGDMMPDVATGFGATAVWRANTTTVSASRRAHGASGFDMPVTISNTTPTAFIPNPPSVCQDPFTGDAVAVWNEIGPGFNNIVANRFTGGSWGSPITVAAHTTFTSVDGGLPVVCDQSGNATVAWHAVPPPQGGYNAVPYAARYEVNPIPPGTPGWQPPVQIGPDEGTSNASGQVVLQVDGSGAVLAVWAANNASVTAGKLLSNRYTPGPGWADSNSAKVIHASMTSHFYPAVALDPMLTAGPAAVVWLDLVGPMSSVNASVIDDTQYGEWGPPEVVSYPVVSSSPPRVSMDPSGQVRALWVQSGAIYSAERP